ncbi:phosphatidylserine synthase [Shigella boydii]|nr:phosphatidylserine synthase [Shigella boydii]
MNREEMHCDVVKIKRNKHQQHLAQLPKISQSVDDVDFFYAPADFRETLLEK